MLNKSRFRVLMAVPILLTVLFAAGCGSSAPACADSDTTDLVIDISRGELVKKIGQETADLITLEVGTIRTQSVDEKTGACSCAADLVMTGPKGTSNVPITYKSELVEGDGDQFYVTVYGL